ncbi:hypothetical protein [Schaalia sp. Marseille-Q2122]|uniref:hypothetical protein n=1 Tax=Schaalia sp. Marseille-Q2122 TaxID=2736604 RepID=UPI00158BE512|nr:hypothetical protein [Schaalia sp. Marseille-Q2122]
MRSWLFGPSEIAQREQARARQEAGAVDNLSSDEVRAAAVSAVPDLPAGSGVHVADAAASSATRELARAEGEPEDKATVNEAHTAQAGTTPQSDTAGEHASDGDASLEELTDVQRQERAGVKEQDANFEGQAPSA